ncbi:MAG: hypothetical protein O4808_14945 [Trichodesmium sp. St17_bin3_1_1]|nr:hypothetical protein [Trichodesmium sp. St17_bin3_1_1]MDE5119298.1 hypothetical protein [Trichodesmium sp. St19_bin1]
MIKSQSITVENFELIFHLFFPNVPLGKTRQEAVYEAELGYKQAKAANNGQSFQLHYRSCRQKSQTIQLKNNAYREGIWFPKKVKGMLFCTAIGYLL